MKQLGRFVSVERNNPAAGLSWSTATGIRTPVSGLRIASVKPFAADAGRLRPVGSVEFDPVRWSRGHISGHGFEAEARDMFEAELSIECNR